MKTITHFVVLLLAILVISPSASAAAYLKFEGVDGESADSKHKGWIDLESTSWGASNPATGSNGSGTNTCATGVVRFRATGRALSQLQQKCTASVPIPMPVYEINGVRHELEGAKLTCQGGDQFVMNFTSCRTHPAAGSGGMSAGKVSVHDISITKAVPNGKVSVHDIQVTKATGGREASAPAISEVVVTKVQVDGSRATLILAGSAFLQKIATMPRGGAGVEIPELNLSINGGPNWTFYGGSHALYQDITIPANAQGASGGRAVQLTLDFQRMTGPAGTWEPATRQ
jgi:hypothetical protein